MIIRDDIPRGFTRDAQGHVLTRKDSDGYWYEYTRGADGRELSCKDSDGRWSEYARDADGGVLTYACSHMFDGALMHARAADDEYTLVVSDAGQVIAGCRRFDTIAEALAHWDRDDKRARKFTAALNALQPLRK